MQTRQRAPGRFTRCEEIAREAERLIDDGFRRAGLILLDQVRATCLFRDDPCPFADPCRQAVRRVESKLAPDDG